MKPISYQNFFHEQFDDLPLSEDALFGTIFLPEKHRYLVEEAQNCDLNAIRKLKEMFTYGKEGITPNFEIAKRYWYALHSHAEVSCWPDSISDSLDDYAHILDQFNRPLADQADAYALAINYMTNEVPPVYWDLTILQQHLARLQEITDLLTSE